MASLYVDRRGVEMRLDGGAIVFYEKAERVGTVPIAPIERVFLRGDVLLHASVLGRLGEHGIGVIVLSGRRADPTLMLPRAHNDAERRVSQYRLSQDAGFCLEFARQLVGAKLAGSEMLLEELREKNRRAWYAIGKVKEQLGQLAKHIHMQPGLAALRGLEGRAAASYFSALAAYMPDSLGFTGRNRRPPRDPLNALLSLGYTMLHSETVVELHGAGLDPQIGFYHGLHFGRASLASDLIEPLRPLVDRFSIGLFSEGHLRRESFSITEQGCLLGKAGRVAYYQLYEAAAEDFRRRIRESIADLLGLMKEKTGKIDVVARDLSDEEF